MKATLLQLLFTFCLLQLSADIWAQPGTSIDLKEKPKRYEKRKLRAEKTQDKKFGFLTHRLQNLYSHYNFYFNANNKLNDVVLRAKSGFRDDYTKLLPFYNYTLEGTLQQKSDLDSVIYKCTAGILLHDLRSDWVDDLYLLMGKAYYYRKNFDSASQVFQYINYAFAKKDDGYDIPIGSNASGNEGVFTVSTPEKTDFWTRLSTKPPSRNSALLWQARNLMETDDINRAAGLLEILHLDPNFPERLQNDLNEFTAYWYYKQKANDSAALYLSKSLENATSHLERARWEFLIAQLYQSVHKYKEASDYYDLAAKHTPDPVMEVHAALNSIDITEGNKEEILADKLNKLLKLAKKEKFEQYRDIFYYAAAQVEIQRGNTDHAKQLLAKSIKSSLNNPQQKSLSFLLLADLNYKSKAYIASKNFYDSIQVTTITDAKEKAKIELRKPALKIIAENLNTINLEDSLQRIAAMPQAERDALLKKILKKQKKLMGIKDDTDDNTVSNPALLLNSNNNQASDLFGAANTKGDWYFNNNSLKSAGFTAFRQKWGTRPNVDNWRRKTATDKITIKKDLANTDDKQKGITGFDAHEPTNADLASKLPLTEELMKKSNDNIAKALLGNGKTFEDKLEDYPAAIDSYEELNRRFAKSNYTDEALFNLVYSYNKTGNPTKADSCKAVLQQQYKGSKWLSTLSNPSPVKVSAKSNANPATKEYERIYNLFIEGKFEKAKQAKTKADSQFGDSYWTPQLLYIESVYYVSKKEDSTALVSLNSLANKYPGTALAEKAKTMIDVLGRRAEIENYLTNLQITRREDEVSQVVNFSSTEPVINQPVKKPDSIITRPVIKNVIINNVDTSAKAPVVIKSFTFRPEEQQYVLLLLDQVAPVYATEARNAFFRFNREKFYNQKIELTSVKLDERYSLLLIGPFTDAIGATDYVDKTKPFTTARILPWLAADKYSYVIISKANLDLLKDNKDVDGYRKLLQTALPGKF